MLGEDPVPAGVDVEDAPALCGVEDFSGVEVVAAGVVGVVELPAPGEATLIT